MKINITIPWNTVKNNYLKKMFLKVLPTHMILGLIIMGIPAIYQKQEIFILYLLAFSFGLIFAVLTFADFFIDSFFKSHIIVKISDSINTDEVDVKINHPNDYLTGHLEE